MSGSYGSYDEGAVMTASRVASRSTIPALAAASAIALVLAYAFVSGCGSCSNCAVPTFVAHPTPPVTNLRVALVSDDGHGTPHGITLLKLEDDNGNPLPVPTATVLPIPAAGDLDGEDLTPNGARGAAIDG